MKEQRKKIAIFLDGPVRFDGRVRRIVDTLSQDSLVDLYYLDGENTDNKLFKDNVNLYSTKKDTNWFKKNIFFQLQFKQLKAVFLKNNNQYDYIYCNDYPLLNLCVELKKITSAKLIYDTHEIWIETINQFFPKKGFKGLYGNILILINKKYHYLLEKKLVTKIDYLFTVCDSFKKYFEKTFNIPKVYVLRNCPVISDYPKKNDFIKNKYNIGADKYLLIYQGNLNDGRGLVKLIKSFKYLSGHSELVLIGGGTLKISLEKIVANNNITNVHFLGKVPFNELLNHTASADAGIMLIQPINKSKELTLPNKAFEYMFAKIPVISNHLPETKKIIQENNCGIIINDVNCELIAEEIKNKLQSKDNLKKLGLNGFNAITLQLNWQNEVKELLNIIK
jgi:glycosyltransferase involved in cell wall biosynthesis